MIFSLYNPIKFLHYALILQHFDIEEFDCNVKNDSFYKTEMQNLINI